MSTFAIAAMRCLSLLLQHCMFVLMNHLLRHAAGPKLPGGLEGHAGLRYRPMCAARKPLETVVSAAKF